jgi:hypothetical protein
MLAKQNGWYEPPIEISQILAEVSKELSLTQADKPQRYKLQSVEELISTGPVRWRVKGVVPERGLAAIYGQSGTGKTFLALDMAISIANGSDWFGYRVKPCPVVYICLEGVAGLSVRLKAYCAKVGNPSGVSFITQALNLREDKDLIDLLASIKACNQTGGIVVIDTLNMATPGMDENSSVDMGRAIQAAKMLEQVVGGLVLLVHHSGKTSGKGLRGHSSLLAALDAVIEVTQSGGTHEWTVTKAKDAGNGKSHFFMLESVVMGVDADGDPITSCVVHPNEGSGMRTKPLTQVQKMGMDAFVAAASKTAASNGPHLATLEDWRPEFYRRSTAESQDGKRKAFTRVRNDLVGLGYLTVINDIYSIPSPFANLPIKS